MHPFRFGIQCRGPAERDGWRDLARRVEDLGWSTLTIADHFDDALRADPRADGRGRRDDTLRVGTMVLANDYRHPVVLAKEAATLDVLTGGRFDLGIGAGWMTTDYEAAGIALDRPGMRIERLAEALAVMRGSGPTSRAPSPATTTGSPGSTASRSRTPGRTADPDRRWRSPGPHAGRPRGGRGRAST